MQTLPGDEVGMASEPLELVVRGEEAAVAFACPTCGAVFSARVSGAKDLAKGHCGRACRCGHLLPTATVLCKVCIEKERVEREALLFEKALKISIDDYPDQPVYWEGHTGSMGFGFFENIDELCDVFDEEREEPPNRALQFPKYVWACVPKPLEISAEALVQSAVEGNNGSEVVGPEAVEWLQTLLDGWMKEQGARSWFPDFSRAVLLEEVAPHG